MKLATPLGAVLVVVVVLVAGSGGLASAQPFRKGPMLQSVDATSGVLLWESSESLPARVVVAVAGVAGAPARELAGPATRLHEVRIDGLAPGTRHTWRVECGGETATGELITAPLGPQPFTFVVFGDSRTGHEPHRALVARIRDEAPAFVLGTGDMVFDGGVPDDWQKFFDIERALLAERPLFPAVGNHDLDAMTLSADAYRQWFALPGGSPMPERIYAFTWAGVRVLVLDSNGGAIPAGDQTAWLEDELQAAAFDQQIEHVFVALHHPIYSTATHGGHAGLREAWGPLFERYGVDAVFSGHDHLYEHLEQNGVRYFVSGGGGAPLYRRNPLASAVDVAASVLLDRSHHYLRVQVAGGAVEVTAIRVDGSIIETTTWGDERRRERARVAARDARATAAAPSARTERAVGPALRPGRTAGGCGAGGCSVGRCSVGGAGAGAGGGSLLVVLLLLARVRFGRGSSVRRPA